ncbi:hypothetical protein OS493_011668 [Desmophyllum pertusum]|uniref:Uncharacterized protein n=1 Tax=Desmophyllum pertusum TaxID=174260 RepID=A0A9W9YQY2_9CNID|nr:hypothetical protein OS493_011668 [Desmophyllum pertusum]
MALTINTCPGLHCLLEGDLGYAKQDNGNPVRSVSALTVQQIWQRIVYDQWIVGVDVENSGESIVSDLTLGLVSCQPEDISYSSKTAICGDNSRHHKQPVKSKLSLSPKSPTLKRKRTDNTNLPTASVKHLLPGNQTRLTAVSSLPRFTSMDSCSISVVATWTSQDGNLDCHSMHCGHVTLLAEQIMDGSLQLNNSLDRKSIQQDIVALRSVSIETEVIETAIMC